MHPDDRASSDEVRAALYQPHASEALHQLGRMRAKDGSYRWMEARATPQLSESGEVTGIVAALRDVDDLVRAREQAEAEGARLQATLDSLLDPHVMMQAIRDASGRIIDFECTDGNPGGLPLHPRDAEGTDRRPAARPASLARGVGPARQVCRRRRDGPAARPRRLPLLARGRRGRSATSTSAPSAWRTASATRGGTSPSDVRPSIGSRSPSAASGSWPTTRWTWSSPSRWTASSNGAPRRSRVSSATGRRTSSATCP